jgi:hypothetical protein
VFQSQPRFRQFDPLVARQHSRNTGARLKHVASSSLIVTLFLVQIAGPHPLAGRLGDDELVPTNPTGSPWSTRGLRAGRIPLGSSRSVTGICFIRSHPMPPSPRASMLRDRYTTDAAPAFPASCLRGTGPQVPRGLLTGPVRRASIPSTTRGGHCMKCPSCQIESPSDAEFCPDCGTSGRCPSLGDCVTGPGARNRGESALAGAGVAYAPRETRLSLLTPRLLSASVDLAHNHFILAGNPKRSGDPRISATFGETLTPSF